MQYYAQVRGKSIKFNHVYCVYRVRPSSVKCTKALGIASKVGLSIPSEHRLQHMEV